MQAFRPELGYWDLYYNGETSPALLGDSLTSVRALTQTTPIRTLAEVDSMYDSLSCEWAILHFGTLALLCPCSPTIGSCGRHEFFLGDVAFLSHRRLIGL